MTLRYEIPGTGELLFETLLLDLNGTLTDRGRLIEGVNDRLQRLRSALIILLLSADTLGTLGELSRGLGVSGQRIAEGSEKSALVRELGAAKCVAIGNGRNDAAMLAEARLGIAVIGPEGASSITLASSDLVCTSIIDALDLLIDHSTMASSLRS